MGFDPILIEATGGKTPIGGGVTTGITWGLTSEWRIKFWSGVGTGTITGGTLALESGYLNFPIEATGGGDTIIPINEIGGTIAVTGSGVTSADYINIAASVWQRLLVQGATMGSAEEILQRLEIQTQ